MKHRGWLLMVLVIILFHWKLWLTNQYTWLESPDLAAQVLPWYEFSAYEVHHGRLPLWIHSRGVGNRCMPGCRHRLRILPIGCCWQRR